MDHLMTCMFSSSLCEINVQFSSTHTHVEYKASIKTFFVKITVSRGADRKGSGYKESAVIKMLHKVNTAQAALTGCESVEEAEDVSSVFLLRETSGSLSC